MSSGVLAVFRRQSGTTTFGLDELLTSSWTSAGFKALLAGDLDTEYSGGQLGARVSGHFPNVNLIHPASSAQGDQPTILDYDGDGRANVLAIDQDTLGGSVNGHGLQPARENLGSLRYGEKPIYLDINGDGMRDAMFPTEGNFVSR